jgi:hypothetical protein
MDKESRKVMKKIQETFEALVRLKTDTLTARMNDDGSAVAREEATYE